MVEAIQPRPKQYRKTSTVCPQFPVPNFLANFPSFPMRNYLRRCV